MQRHDPARQRGDVRPWQRDGRSGEFWKSTSGLAHDSNDRIIYETDTGWLYYDSNGSAAGGAVHIAKLAPNLALTYADFLVI